MRIVIAAGGPAPASEQVRSQVVEAVKDDRLVPGERMPTVRALAVELGLAPNTIAKAYRELESDGVIETRGRSGTFVSTQGDASHRRLQEAAAEYAALARRLKVPTDDAVHAVEAALRIGT
ncbi:GntR family transcriptional regulator [Agromyces protaetiae]|uniref:GntR family transcriptional regulator n=1 Tax=Agromyces protaetiae TaxID=2509455 RepID=UPI001FB58966|nr:GntR family transcriptional regulator [Agromyces protaetiae]